MLWRVTPATLKEGQAKMMVGYAWISPGGVDCELQRKAFEEADVERLVIDVQHKFKPRHAKLKGVLSSLGSGDAFVVYSLDTLGLSVWRLMELVGELTQKGITFRSLRDNLDSSTSMWKIMYQTLGQQLGNLDRSLVRGRTAAGLAAAKAPGRIGGRRLKLDKEKRAQAIALHMDPGTTVTDNCRKLDISRATYYRHVDIKTTRKPGRKPKTKVDEVLPID